jgi:protein TonB
VVIGGAGVSATGSGAGVRALRELGLAFRNGSFRVALVLSVLVHLALLLVFFHGGSGGEGDRGVKLMRVRLLQPASEPVPDPAVPAVPRAVKPPSGRAERPAAVVPKSPVGPVPTDSAPVASPPVLQDHVSPLPSPEQGHEPAPATASAAPARTEPHLLSAAEAPSRPATAAIAPLEPLLGAAVESPDPAAMSGAGESSAAPADAASGSGSASGPSAAGATQGEGFGPAGTGAQAAGQQAAGIVREGPNPDGTDAAGGPAGQPGPGPRDLAAIRRRIEARKVYPQIAVRNGWEGRVLVEMHLEGDGSLAAVRLLQGSGYEVLDEATLTAVRRASPFPPVARVLTVPVEYRLVP